MTRLPGLAEDDFLLTLVHDARAYLRLGLTSAQLLERSLPATVDPPQRKYLEGVVGACKDLDLFLARLSDYASAGRRTSRAPVTLDSALRAALLQFPSGLAEVSYTDSSAAVCQTRPELQRVFFELIDNALKFSQNQPIRIEAGPGNSPERITVEIADRGAGIPAQDLDLAVLPFSRLNSRDQYPGFGLGLPICLRIAQAVDAKISLRPGSPNGLIAAVTFQPAGATLP
jgi:signal transduction histidine kinase